MAKGSKTKNQLAANLQKIYGDKFKGVYNKRIYIVDQEDGEEVILALAITCPRALPNMEEDNSTVTISSQAALDLIEELNL